MKHGGLGTNGTTNYINFKKRQSNSNSKSRKRNYSQSLNAVTSQQQPNHNKTHSFNNKQQ